MDALDSIGSLDYISYTIFETIRGIMAYKNYEDQKKCWRRHYQNNKQKYKDKSKQTRVSSRRWLQEYLKFHPCVRCGETDIRVLDFDHLRDKVTEVTSLVQRCCGVAKVKEEISKCQVLCSNCHRIITWERRQPSSTMVVASDFESDC